MIVEVSSWLAGFGVQWLLDYPGPFPERIARGEVYLAYLPTSAKPIATVSLDDRADPEFWGRQQEDAGYVHRLAVRRRYAGHEIGATLLDFAGDQVAAGGRPWLRLDCHKENTKLHRYYETHGFEHLTTIDIPSRRSGALFQRPAVRDERITADPDKPGIWHFRDVVALTSQRATK
ncbi:MAG: GNAT family N-acetyltransferase [Actinomycetes bacterium]